MVVASSVNNSASCWYTLDLKCNGGERFSEKAEDTSAAIHES